MTVALHAVFDSPRDKMIFDVSHQTYIHKMLTGRGQAFWDPAHYSDVSGYTNPKESDHDFVYSGAYIHVIVFSKWGCQSTRLKNEEGNVIGGHW